MRLNSGAPGQILHIAVIPIKDMVMSIRAEKREIGYFTFKVGEYHRVDFPSDLISEQPLVIEFSSYITDVANRRMAFLLQDTNPFNEVDL